MNLSGNYALTAECAEGLFGLHQQLQAVSTKPAAAATAMPQIINGTAIINVVGIIFPKANIFTLFGIGVAIDALAEQLTAAENNPLVSKIVFSFDSPGGSITGVNEFSNQINAATKPTAAYVTGQAASAGYWLAAACNEIIIDDTAILGSIGVVAVMQPRGDGTIEIVSSHAADKRPDLDTEAGRDTIRATLNDIEAVFHQSIVAHRPKMTIDALKALRGNVRVGAKAVSTGLADRVGSQKSVIAGQMAKPTFVAKPVSAALPAHPTALAPTPKVDDYGWRKAFANAGIPLKDAKTEAGKPAASAPMPKTDAHGWGKAFANVQPDRSDASAPMPASSSGDNGWGKAFAKVQTNP